MWVADFKEQIELRLVEFLEAEQAKAPTVEAGLLLSRISSLVLRGGKRFRPSLLFMTYIAYGGKQPKTIIDLGLALEIYHQFLLVHDDIIDEDTIRYDGPNIVGFYNKDKRYEGTKIPMSMGVLAGDMLMTLVSQLILDDPSFTLKQKKQILELFNETTIGAIYGQQLDSLNVPHKALKFSEKRLIKTHSLKTALYTTKLPMKLAAFVLDIPEAEVSRISNFAGDFGIYFQLVDDHNDYFKTESSLNDRPKFRDFAQGKITYPYYVSMKLGSEAKQAVLRLYFGDKNLDDDHKQKILTVMQAAGAEEASKLYCEQYYHNAINSLKELGISEKRKQRFKDLIDEIKL